MNKLKSKKFWISLVGMAVMLVQLLGVKIDVPVVSEIVNSVCAALVFFGLITDDGGTCALNGTLSGENSSDSPEKNDGNSADKSEENAGSSESSSDSPEENGENSSGSSEENSGSSENAGEKDEAETHGDDEVCGDDEVHADGEIQSDD